MKQIKPIISGNKKFWDTRKQEPLVEELTKYLTSGQALDMGAGYTGRDAFYLAGKGLKTIAAEIDDECIIELNRRNSIASSPLAIIKADLLTYQPEQLFDAVVCNMVLHFLKADQVPVAIQNLQEWTKPGGFNVVMAYTTDNPPGKRPYLFKPNELFNYYKNWQKIFYAEEPTPWFHIKGESKPRRNEAVYLLAQKTPTSAK